MIWFKYRVLKRILGTNQLSKQQMLTRLNNKFEDFIKNLGGGPCLSNV